MISLTTVSVSMGPQDNIIMRLTCILKFYKDPLLYFWYMVYHFKFVVLILMIDQHVFQGVNSLHSDLQHAFSAVLR